MTHMINIQPRKPRFDLSDVPVFWNDGDPVLTRFFDALSIHFPDGERFFIQSVRNYQDLVTDPKLREDIKNFFRQEAQHGIVHDQYNAVMHNAMLRFLAKRSSQDSNYLFGSPKNTCPPSICWP